jgi:hypothetical protein
MWWFQEWLRKLPLKLSKYCQMVISLHTTNDHSTNMTITRGRKFTSSKKLMIQPFGLLYSGSKCHWIKWSMTRCRIAGIGSILPENKKSKTKKQNYRTYL